MLLLASYADALFRTLLRLVPKGPASPDIDGAQKAESFASESIDRRSVSESPDSLITIDRLPTGPLPLTLLLSTAGLFSNRIQALQETFGDDAIAILHHPVGDAGSYSAKLVVIAIYRKADIIPNTSQKAQRRKMTSCGLFSSRSTAAQAVAILRDMRLGGDRVLAEQDIESSIRRPSSPHLSGMRMTSLRTTFCSSTLFSIEPSWILRAGMGQRSHLSRSH